MPSPTARALIGILGLLINLITSRRALTITYSCCAGNSSVTFYEMDSIYGHDTFLLDTTMGTAIKVIIDESLGCCLNGCCFVSGSLRATLKKE